MILKQLQCTANLKINLSLNVEGILHDAVRTANMNTADRKRETIMSKSKHSVVYKNIFTCSEDNLTKKLEIEDLPQKNLSYISFNALALRDKAYCYTYLRNLFMDSQYTGRSELYRIEDTRIIVSSLIVSWLGSSLVWRITHWTHVVYASRAS